MTKCRSLMPSSHRFHELLGCVEEERLLELLISKLLMDEIKVFFFRLAVSKEQQLLQLRW